MRLRNDFISDPYAVATTLSAKTSLKWAAAVRFVLYIALFVILYQVFKAVEVDIIDGIRAIYNYFVYCIYNIFSRSPEYIFLLFAPALLLDTTRYYIPNMLVFFVNLFKREREEELDPNMPHPLVSVILPVYNEESKIRRTIDALLESDYPNVEIIVVDDCSSDRTALICKAYNDSGKITFLKKTERGGKPAALNYGFQFAKGEYIFHFDGEVIVFRNTIRKAIIPFKNPKVGVVSGNLKVANDKTNFVTRLQAAEYAMCISMGRIWLSWTNMLQIASGAFGVFRRELVERVMGTDPEVGEDSDITLKIKKLGYKVVFAAKAIAKTNVPETWHELSKQRIRWDACYVRINLRKHGNIAKFNQFKFMDFVAFVSDFILNLLFLLIFPIYIAAIAGLVPELFIFIITVTYIFYTVMNFIQFVMASIVAGEAKRDWSFVLLSPVFFIYGLYLRLLRTTAYIWEGLRLKTFNKGYLPAKIWESQPRF
ncbi:glycosyltransferase [Thermoproteota archaeon]